MRHPIIKQSVRSPMTSAWCARVSPFAVTLTLSLLSAGLSGCKNTVRFPRQPMAPLPSASPETTPTRATPPPPAVVPDTTLKLEIKSLNAESWWKVCLEAWVLEFPQTRQAVGCNTDTNLVDKVISLDGSSQQCNTIGLSFQVFKNTRPCTGTAASCAHEATPMLTRTTSNPGDRNVFRAAYLGALKLPFQRADLTEILIPASESPKYQGYGDSKAFRVFFEDQPDAAFTAVKNGASARTLGIDYFDYVVEFGSSKAPLALEGQSAISCEPK